MYIAPLFSTYFLLVQVIELLSIQLTQYALVTLRNKARDDTFIANIGTYLIPASSNNNHSIHSNQSNNSGGAAGGGLPSAGFPGSHVDSRSTSRMPQNAVTRKRVYDVYASESGKMAHRHAFDQELSRRRMALFLYLIRSPIFDRCVKNWCYNSSV